MLTTKIATIARVAIRIDSTVDLKGLCGCLSMRIIRTRDHEHYLQRWLRGVAAESACVIGGVDRSRLHGGRTSSSPA
jgi:hypothetical protein